MKKQTKQILKTYPFKSSVTSAVIVALTMSCSSGTNDTEISLQPKEQLQHQTVQKRRVADMHIRETDALLESESKQKIMNYASKSRIAQPLFYPKPNPVPNNENYQHYTENGIQSVMHQPVSTFSIDVDTGSYTNVRRIINQGQLPPVDAVRVEEFINYFDYGYDAQSTLKLDTPFSINTAIATSPWAQQRHIMRIGLKGYTADVEQISGRNLVFLLDVSGSMNQANKLPLLTRSLQLLTSQLDAQDSVSIVVYAGASGVVLPPTKGDQTAKIKQALQRLSAGGSTNGQAGIELAYNMAEQAYIKGGVNRVILATDGDFNVGITDHKKLIDLIKQKRQKGIALTTLGFGQGNYNDHLMEQLADAGDGNYAYIDTIHEARKVLVDEMDATLLTIAKDVKIQVEFNPNLVSEYRLIGYENRQLNREDFNNDKVDAGEIGAGHSVTAMYELTLTASNNQYLDPLRYQAAHATDKSKSPANVYSDELAVVKLRYKPLDSETSQLITQTVKAAQIKVFNEQSTDFRFASSVVGFAHLLKQSHYWQNLNYQDMIDMAVNAKGKDEFGYRAEFINLLRTSASLQAGLKSSNNESYHAIKLNPQSIAHTIEGIPVPALSH